ncbi:hypothetical protein [Pseudomonas sp. LB3P14]
MQHNEVISLNLAVASIDGVVNAPGVYFSFCRLVGDPGPRIRPIAIFS